MHWMVSLMCYLGCMAININALFAEWRITEHDSIQILLLGIFSGMEPTIYFQIYIDAVTDSFHVLDGKYIFPQLTLLIVLRALVHLIHLVSFNNFFVFNFPFFQFRTIISFSLDKYYLLIFDVVLHYQLNAVKIPKMV